MMRRKEPRVLYFTKGPEVSEEDRKAADRIGRNVGFRNASLAQHETVEKCDAVAGSPPRNYSKVYETVSDEDELNDLMDRKAAEEDNGEAAIDLDALDGTNDARDSQVSDADNGGGSGDQGGGGNSQPGNPTTGTQPSGGQPATAPEPQGRGRRRNQTTTPAPAPQWPGQQ